MPVRHFPTFCTVCKWTGYFDQDLPAPQFPDEATENCPNHGGLGLERMNVEIDINGLAQVRAR